MLHGALHKKFVMEAFIKLQTKTMQIRFNESACWDWLAKKNFQTIKL